MYIVCPLCKSAYIVDDKFLGKPLPKAKCCVCNNIWQLKQERTEHPAAGKQRADNDLLTLGEKIAGSKVQKQLKKKLTPKKKRLLLDKLFGFSFALVLFVIFGIIWAARVELAEKYPIFHVGFDMLGINSVIEGYGLEFRSIHYRNVKIDNMDVLEISGMVVNKTNNSRFIPAILATLYDKGGKKLEGKTVYINKNYLSPLGAASFSIRIYSPNIKAEKVTVSFTSK